MTEFLKPTLLIDESHYYGAEEQNSIRVLFNVYRPGQSIPRVAFQAKTKPKDRLEFFSPYGFKAYAGLRSISDNVEDRCVPIKMQRNMKKISRRIDETTARALRGKLLRWKEQPLRKVDERIWAGIPKHPWSKTADNRLSELFETLLLNTPSIVGNNQIVSLMWELNRQKIMDTFESLDRDILEMFGSIGLKKDDGFVSTSELTNLICERSGDFRNHVSDRQVAAILGNFDFKRRRKHYIRGFVFNLDRFNKLCPQYGIDLTEFYLTYKIPAGLRQYAGNEAVSDCQISTGVPEAA
jgi:hypothetical protein